MESKAWGRKCRSHCRPCVHESEGEIENSLWRRKERKALSKRKGSRHGGERDWLENEGPREERRARRAECGGVSLRRGRTFAPLRPGERQKKGRTGGRAVGVLI